MFTHLRTLKNNTLIRYIFVGGLSYAIELITLLTLANSLHLSPLVSVGISFWIGLVMSFILQKFLAFNNRSVKAKHLLKQSTIYIALVAVNYLFTLFFVNVMAPHIGLVPSRTVALILTTIWNFFIYKRILFSTVAASGRRKSQGITASQIRVFSYSLCILLGLFLAGYAALGLFSRPMADDLIFLNGYGWSDFFANSSYLYTVNGRLTTLTIYLLGFTIPFISELTPLLTLVILGVGLYLCGNELLRDKISVTLLRSTALLSTLAILTTLVILVPSAQSSIFWFSAAVVHIWSYGCILILTALYLSLRRRYIVTAPRYRILALYFIIASIIALFGEMPALTVIALHLFALVVDFAQRNTRFIKLTLSGMFAGIVAFCWLYFAPASLARRAAIEASGGLTAADFAKTLPKEIIENITVELPYLYINKTLLISFFCFALLIGLYLARKNSLKKSNIITWLALALLLSLFHFVNFSLTYLAGGSVPLRIYPSSTLGIVIATYLFGFISGHLLQRLSSFRRGLVLGAVVTLALTSMLSASLYTPSMYAMAKELKSHAAAWDSRDRYIKNEIKQGNCSIHTISLPIGDIGDIDQSPTHWINRQGIENYYRPPTNPAYWKTCEVTGTGKFGQ